MILSNWTIVKENENTSYVIGIDEHSHEIETTDIREIVDINNNNVIVRTKNSIYKLYFDSHFEPTYKQKILYNWQYNDDNSLTGYLDYDNWSQWHSWTTTPVVRTVHDAYIKSYDTGHRNLYDIVYTESGSSYLLSNYNSF